jgi:hypothetical protein
MIELYVELKACWNTSNEDCAIEDLEFNIGLDDINLVERVEKLISQDTTLISNTCGNDGFMNMDFISFEDLNYNSEEKLYETMTSWPLRDRSNSHPVALWNNINAIIDIIGYCDYFDDEGYVTEDGLALGQCFRSKDHLKWTCLPSILFKAHMSKFHKRI